MRQLESRTVVPHEDSQYELDTQDVAIITMQPHPSRLVPQTQVSSPYSRAGYMDQTTTSDDANVERSVSPHEVDNDVGD